MKQKHDELRLLDLTSLVAHLIREVDTVVVHCSATTCDTKYDSHSIEHMHMNRPKPFSEIGYNLILTADAKLVMGRDWNKIPAHVAGNNRKTLGLVYIGGVDANGNYADTRTPEQEKLMFEVLGELSLLFKGILNVQLAVKGHRDYSPDLDGDGIIEPHEWIKVCPCFDVQQWVTTYAYEWRGSL